ncbi:unnamed protein product [Lymnaea stagnalis]|uniref:Chitin-binding type-2 domain-containing protein n=1 Tax=Lymnaea stagnalis TaxID=6523 RepID=A0AAV2H020_LYMST
MGATAIFSLLTVAVFAQSTFAYELLLGSRADYNALCTSPENNQVVGLPASACDLTKYIVCWKGQAAVVMDCQVGYRFNNRTTWCELKENVPLPNGCSETTVPKTPTTCEQNGPGYMPAPNTCKFYVWCVQGGYNYTLPCPKLSFFIHRLATFVYITEPYRYQMLDSEYDECMRKDPYTVDEIEGRTTTRRA